MKLRYWLEDLWKNNKLNIQEIVKNKYVQKEKLLTDTPRVIIFVSEEKEPDELHRTYNEQCVPEAVNNECLVDEKKNNTKDENVDIDEKNNLLKDELSDSINEERIEVYPDVYFDDIIQDLDEQANLENEKIFYNVSGRDTHFSETLNTRYKVIPEFFNESILIINKENQSTDSDSNTSDCDNEKYSIVESTDDDDQYINTIHVRTEFSVDIGWVTIRKATLANNSSIESNEKYR